MAQVLRRPLELKSSRWGQMGLSFPGHHVTEVSPQECRGPTPARLPGARGPQHGDGVAVAQDNEGVATGDPRQARASLSTEGPR